MKTLYMQRESRAHTLSLWIYLKVMAQRLGSVELLSAAASVSECQQAVAGSKPRQRQRAPASASQSASQPGELDRQTDRSSQRAVPAARSADSREPHCQPANQASRQPGCSSGQFAAESVFRSVALLYESPAETRLTVYRRSQHCSLDRSQARAM